MEAMRTMAELSAPRSTGVPLPPAPAPQTFFARRRL